MLKSETLRIAKAVNTSQGSTPSVVGRMFSELHLSDSERELLQQEALVVRVNQLLTSGALATAMVVADPIDLVVEKPSVLPERPYAARPGIPAVQPDRVVDVEVRILGLISYDILGRRVPVKEMTLGHLNILIQSFDAKIDGMENTRDFFIGVRDRLKTLKKQKVSDLARGELTQLARRLEALKKRQQLVAA